MEMGAVHAGSVLSGRVDNWEAEQGNINYPWGWPGQSHKQFISPYKYITTDDGNEKITFSYDDIQKHGYVLQPNGKDLKSGSPIHTQIYLSRPYNSLTKDREGSVLVKKPTADELEEMDFGLKQKGPLYYTSDNQDGTGRIPYYTLEEHLEGQERISNENDEEDVDTLKQHSKHQMVINKTCVNMNGKRKLGLGPKFYNRGSNACINAIVTRYDRYGNVQMMAMVRPKNADSDAGDYQMSAGCIFFGQDLQFNGCNIEGKTSTPYGITDGETNINEFGALQGRGLAYARGAVYTKLWHGEEYKKIIDTWDFNKIAEGIVDDVSNTSEAWVETSYNVHHIMGTESNDELDMLSNAKVNAKHRNVGNGVWRSIDRNPYDPEHVYSQVYEEGSDEPMLVKHEGTAVKFDPFVEFDLWHGDHSFVAALVSDYIKERYQFEGAVDATSPFGRSSFVVKSSEGISTCGNPEEKVNRDGKRSEEKFHDDVGATDHTCCCGNWCRWLY